MDLMHWSKEDLIKLLETYAQNWLAHDGCWFLAAEETFDMETAIELDKKGWERFTVVEGKRIMKNFDIPENGGLDALEKVLQLRLYAMINKQEIVREDGKLIFKMIDCRVQAARERKKLPLFPCRPVGEVEYSLLAKTVDARIHTKCLGCPPDPAKNAHCVWEFSIQKE